MTTRRVQISLDEKLLQAIDRRKETRERGRSAFIRRAIESYLELDRRREIDCAYEEAYGGRGGDLMDEFSDLLAGQAWPEE